MKWHQAQNGDKRIITKFALFPVLADEEWRWFEYVTIEQKFIFSEFGSKWVTVQFVDDIQGLL